MLGVGKFITSITMTIFYLILYYIWRERYQIKEKKGLTLTMWVLSILRIALCFLPQNQWLEYRQPNPAQYSLRHNGSYYHRYFR